MGSEVLVGAYGNADIAEGYQLTGAEKCPNWFKKIHDYTGKHFKDREYPEWFGYLNRSGEVLLTLKGEKWKGCFHIPRELYQCWKTLAKIHTGPAEESTDNGADFKNDA